MLADSKRQVIFPETDQAVRLLFPVPVNIQVNFRSLGIDERSDLSGRIESFGISQVIEQLGEVSCHFIRVCRWLVLYPQPAVLIFFYKKGFSQFGLLPVVKYSFLQLQNTGNDQFWENV